MAQRFVQKIYLGLLQEYGPQRWWPITTVDRRRLPPPQPMTEPAAFEIAIGAILTQSTSWKNVELALCNLKRARVLRPRPITNLPLRTLARLIRPSGYYRQKAKKLKAFAAWLNRRGGRLLSWSSKQPLVRARAELLTIHGIGPETADSILLYACGKPAFVVDAYTKRLLTAHGRSGKSYDVAQRYFTERLPRSVRMYQEFHALIVRWGKEKSKEGLGNGD